MPVFTKIDRLEKIVQVVCIKKNKRAGNYSFLANTLRLS